MHNRWHPDIAPGRDGRAGRGADARRARTGWPGSSRERAPMPTAPHSTSVSRIRLPGRSRSSGRKPGDVLEVEFLEYRSADFGVTAVIPGFGFLADRFTDPFLVKWEIADGVARSGELPGVAVPAEMFAGVVGVAPSLERLEAASRAARSGSASAAAPSRIRCRRPPSPGRAAGGPADDPAAGDRRQPRHPAARRRQPAVPARRRAGRAVLDRRPPFRPG